MVEYANAVPTSGSRGRDRPYLPLKDDLTKRKGQKGLWRKCKAGKAKLSHSDLYIYAYKYIYIYTYICSTENIIFNLRSQASDLGDYSNILK